MGFFLSQRGYFKETYFINYLKYLLYWKRPEYARALKYPQCLHFLEAVQSADFREALACSANAKFIEEQQMLQWQYYTRKRQRLHVSNCTFQNVQLLCLSFLILLIPIICPRTVDLPSRCESCLLFARELEELSKKNSVKDELSLIEINEELCNRMLDYKLHQEKKGIKRFSKQESSTAKAINKLRKRGVKVELGMPDEMWDNPPVEIVSLKQQCESMLENYEDDVAAWYNVKPKISSQEYLCENRILHGDELSCLKESKVGHVEF
ncbi:unnamed protein product [Dracunculus medinensis]|uniref:Mediator of RNA polymerase II transcription subunit 31 n=1 Tax=Dracunculus medinensis TaxID=318479 RepID=A0A0N4ULH4_DRAME|nr:unnamed protein product [Dracunculus medinensis]